LVTKKFFAFVNQEVCSLSENLRSVKSILLKPAPRIALQSEQITGKRSPASKKKQQNTAGSFNESLRVTDKPPQAY